VELSFWTYEGPPHVGAIRIANSMRGVHLVLHAPQGDTYADLLFTMIERDDHRPPVTYTTFQARDLGGDTADLVQAAPCADACERFSPRCSWSAIPAPRNCSRTSPARSPPAAACQFPVVPVEMQAYSRKENWGAAETFYTLVRALLQRRVPPPGATCAREARSRPSVNLLGPSSLGFRCRDDVREVTRLLRTLGRASTWWRPLGATPRDLLRMPEADFNVCLYPEVAGTACDWLARNFKQPTIRTVPIGVGATADFVSEVASTLDIAAPAAAASASRLPWYSRSVDSTYLTGKRVFIFGDATHAIAAARIASEELAFEVVGLGSYSREFRLAACAHAPKELGLEALITRQLPGSRAHGRRAWHPELVLGTQMERHIAKRLGIPCAVISTPAHVQDFRRATPRRWGSRAPTSSSTAGFIR
jgi:light-independent protochlorophyllide reductase subunit B